LEGEGVGFNGNRERLLGEGSLESGGVVWGDVNEGRDLSLSGLNVLVAGTINTHVWVFGLTGEASNRGDILEGIVHETTVAALVVERARAVNEFLFRKVVEVSGEGRVSTFDGTDSGESPA